MTDLARGERLVAPEQPGYVEAPILTHPDGHIASLEAPHVTYLGPEASFSDLAARTLFPEAVKYEPHASFGDIVRSLSANPDLVGIIPVRNEITGDVYDVLTYLRQNGGRFGVLGEAPFMINLVLASRAHRVANISTIYSHPQPIKQASNYIDSLHGVSTHDVESTAKAAEMVRSLRGTAAAICSPQAATKYRLTCLAEEIQNKPPSTDKDPLGERPNATRFVVVQALEGFTPKLEDLLEFHGVRSKVAGIVSPRREEDEGLVEVLSYLQENGIKSSAKISSVNAEKEGGLDYFLELRGDPFQLYEVFDQDNIFTDAIMEFKLLGAYPLSKVVYQAPADIYE